MRGMNIGLKRLKRIKVDQILESIWDVPVTFVTAPMGYGKSTAVREYLEVYKKSDEAAVFWYTFREGQYDTEWFWNSYLATMGEELGLEYLEAFRDKMLPRTAEERHYYLMFVKAMMQHGKCVCVFDDYHDCNSVFLNQIIKDVGRLRIEGFHLIVIERSYPELNYEEMCLKGDCILIEREDLQMNKQEIQDYFALNGQRLSDEEAEHCLEYTDGWISAVYLMYLDYKKSRKISHSATISSLLQQGILYELTEKEKRILCQIVLFQSVTPEQAVYLTGERDAPIVLMNLVQNVNFFDYDKRKRCFTAHAMLRELAEEELLRRGIDREELVLKEAAWYVGQKDMISAILLYQQYGHKEEIYDIIRANASVEFFRKAPMAFEEIYYEMQDYEKANSHSGYVQFLFTQLIYQDFKKSAREYKAFRDILIHYHTCRNELEFYRYLLFLEAAVNQNEASVNSRILKSVNTYLGKSVMLEFGKELRELYAIPEMMFSQHRKTGRYREEVDKIIAIETEMAAYGDMYAIGIKMQVEFEYQYHMGNLKAAKEQALRAYNYSRLNKELTLEVSSIYTYLRCKILLGEADGEKVMNQIHEEINRRGIEKDTELTVVRSVRLMQGDIAGLLGMKTASERWISDTNQNETNNIVRSSGVIQQIAARMLINDGEYETLELLARELSASEYEDDYIFKKVLYRIYLSIACWHTERKAEAAERMNEALWLLEEDQIVTIFAEYALELMPVLELMERSEYADRVYAFCATCRQRHEYNKKVKKKSILSEREEEIMQCVMAGEKNRQISERLHIAQVTVEKTLSSIYRKLNVRNRAGAIVAYQEWVNDHQD